MTYVVCAKWTARSGEAEAVADAIEQLIPPSKEEPGIKMYQAHRDVEDPSVFFFYEQYVDEDAYQAHLDSQHFQELGFGTVIPKLESRERSFYRPWEEESED